MSAPGTESCASSSTLFAEDFHLRLLRLHRVGNRLRREFAEVLRELADSRLFLELGFSDIAQYAERYFSLQRSQTYEWLRAARRLPELPRLRDALDRGEISWSVLLELSKVATAGTETEWLEFSRERSVRQVRSEVREAQRKARDKPRANPSGLPAIEFRMTFDLTPEEHELVRKALRKAALEMSEVLGGGDVPPKDSLVYLARTLLETDPEGMPRGRVEREKPLSTIVYQQCTTCRRSVIPTPDGPVEVSPEVVERAADVSEEVTITPADETPLSTEGKPREGSEQKPGKGTRRSSPARARKVNLRDGGLCRNPRCRRRLDTQAHHIRFISENGENGLHNEVTVCRPCHALIHQGLLTVEGNPFDGLKWKPRADLLSRGLEDDLGLIASLGLGEAELPRSRNREGSSRESGRPDSPRRGDALESGRPDSNRGLGEESLRVLAGGLQRLGYTRREAMSRLEGARGRLLPELEREPTEEELLRETLSPSAQHR